MKKHKFPIYFSGERIFSNKELAFQLAESKKLGERKDGKIIYSIFEALFLEETNQAELIKNNKRISPESLIRLYKDKNLTTKYIVFKELRKKAYIVKTGLKFGEEFRVYDTKSPYQNHAKWIVFPTKESSKIDPKELISKSRITHSTGKKLLLAIVDSEEDVTFYEIDWIKP